MIVLHLRRLKINCINQESDLGVAAGSSGEELWDAAMSGSAEGWDAAPRGKREGPCHWKCRSVVRQGVSGRWSQRERQGRV